MLEPEPWAGTLTTPTLVDENPDPAVVELRLTASAGEVEYLPGKPTTAWTYNGTVPGPTLEAKVGDRLIVHFTNELPEPTTVHWHGMLVPNAMDGTPRVMEPIPPGGTFTYELTILHAGTYWYHPHVRSDVQAEKGLYGAIVVHDPDFDASLPVVADELVVLDDVMLDPATGVADDGLDERAKMMGREGNLVLINGQRANMEVTTRAGAWRRWRIVNGANARYFKLALDGGRMVQIASDGALLPAPQEVAEVFLTPGERADVLVMVASPGATATLRALPYERAIGAGATEAVDVVRLVATDEPAVVLEALPQTLAQVPALALDGATRTIALEEEMVGGDVRFRINGASYPDVPVLHAPLGTVEAWDIVNRTEMDHPFHVHGFRFQTEDARVWKDTINVPAETTLRVLVDFSAREGAEGMWMYHCHILEHEEGGMMGEVMVQ